MCCRNRKRAVVDARQPGAEPAGEALASRARRWIDVLDLLPLHPERRVGEHVVELLARRGRPRRRSCRSTMLLGVLALDHHVGLADRRRTRRSAPGRTPPAGRRGFSSRRYSSATESIPPVPQAGS